MNNTHDTFILTVGLEVHIQLNTKSKMFCGCGNDAVDAAPNTLVCPVCFGMPGTLPVANRGAIEKTLLLGVALDAEPAEAWNFERKNYFYPDLPKGYQITSSTNPPLIGGTLHLPNQHGDVGLEKSIRVNHIHLEEDAGKLIHTTHGYSLVDLNRAGTPLIELVTEPDISSAEDAKAFLREMQMLVRALDISAGDMENGHLRCDANVSVRRVGDDQLGKKVEIKNLNSFSMVEKAIVFEKERQCSLLHSRHLVLQETRSWDDATGHTVPMRSKEDVQDYRYIPEPDIPPIIPEKVPELSQKTLQKVFGQIELPSVMRRSLLDLGVEFEQAQLALQNPKLAIIIRTALASLHEQSPDVPKEVLINLVFGYVYRFVTEKSIPVESLKIGSADLVKLTELLHEGTLTQQIIKTNMTDLLVGKITIADLLKKSIEAQTIDIEKIVKDVLKNNPSVVKQWKGGNAKVFGFLVGQVMAKTSGLADPQAIHETLERSLEEMR